MIVKDNSSVQAERYVSLEQLILLIAEIPPSYALYIPDLNFCFFHVKLVYLTP